MFGAISVCTYEAHFLTHTSALMWHSSCLLQALRTLPDDLAARVVGACPRSIGVRLKVLPQHMHHLVAAVPAWQEVCYHE